ncbi:MAG: hypothetical protein RDV41_05530 [Planctomycetota bacterium]|nr:hypothetical protein [Planctomycetota bacterium]
MNNVRMKWIGASLLLLVAVVLVGVVVWLNMPRLRQSQGDIDDSQRWGKEIDTKKALLRETRVDGMLLMSLRFTPDGKNICVSSSVHFERGGLEVYDPTTLKLQYRIPGIGGDLMEVSRDSRYVAVAASHKAWLIELNSKKLVREFDPPALGFHRGEYPSALAISPDGRLVVLAGIQETSDGTIRNSMVVWEAQSGVLVRRFDFEGEQKSGITFGGLAFSPDGKMLAGGFSGAGVVQIWDASDFHLVKELSYKNPEWQKPGKGLRPQWIAGGTQLMVRCSKIQPRKGKMLGCPIDVWDFDKGTLVSRVTSSASSGLEAISPDNRYIACPSVHGSYEGATYIISVATGKQLGLILCHKNYGVDRAFSPDGKVMVSGDSGTGALCVWDWQEILRQLGETK